MKFIELESERLIYRKFREEDFSVLFDWRGNAENMKYWMSGQKNEAETREYLNWVIFNAETEDCTNYEFAVVLKADNSLIGSAMMINLPNEPEMGWVLHRNYWRQGYGTEMGRTLLRFGFETLNLRRIIAGCNARNTGSYRIMEKIGMLREGYFIKAQRGSSLLNYEWCDRFQYAILQEEWKSAKVVDID